MKQWEKCLIPNETIIGNTSCMNHKTGECEMCLIYTVNIQNLIRVKVIIKVFCSFVFYTFTQSLIVVRKLMIFNMETNLAFTISVLNTIYNQLFYFYQEINIYFLLATNFFIIDVILNIVLSFLNYNKSISVCIHNSAGNMQHTRSYILLTA